MTNGNRFIFISFDQGNGGHKIGRVISCLPDVHWYSHKDNGINPWNVYFKHTDIRQRYTSKYHYDRLVSKGSLPPLHDYVKDFIPDEEHYYKRFFYPRFEKMGGYELMKKNRLVFCTHEVPKKLQERFPKAKIINLVGDDFRIAQRYMKTTAIFPGHLKMKWIGGENTDYGRKLKTIAKEVGTDFTVRDIWAWDNYKSKYIDKYEDEYWSHVRDTIRSRMWDREFISSENVITLSPTKRGKWRRIKRFLEC